MKKKVNKDTKKYQEEVIRKLKKKLLKLWSINVRLKAGNKCEVLGCNATKKINAHHIENYNSHPLLRYNLKNGVALCPKCHRFGTQAAHTSFIFMYKFMTTIHPNLLEYLLNYKPSEEEIILILLEQKKIKEISEQKTIINILEQKIKEMEAISFSLGEVITKELVNSTSKK